MSTHIPADYFTKPILQRLGILTIAEDGWVVPTGGLPGALSVGMPRPVTRAFCGDEAPTGDRILRLEGPVPDLPPVMQSWHGVPYGAPLARAPMNSRGELGRPWLEAKFPGEKTIGYVMVEKHDEHRRRVLQMVVGAVGRNAARDVWVKWQSDNEALLRPRVVLHLPPRWTGVEAGGPLHVPDFAAIDCPRCLAAWDVFAADTGATVEVIPPVEQDDDPDLRESYAEGGKW